MESKKNQLKLYELVKTYDLETIPPINPNEEGWSFRIEILKDCSPHGYFYTRVCRREFYHVRPAFSGEEENMTEQHYIHELIVLDTGRDWEKIKGKTPESVLEQVLNEIHTSFGYKNQS